MFGRRKAASGKQVQRKEEEGSQEEPTAGGPSAAEAAAGGRRPVTLDTGCLCGHTRREHTGMQMEVKGRCLECGCEEFRRAGEGPEADEETIARIKAAVAKVEHLIEAVATFNGKSPK